MKDDGPPDGSRHRSPWGSIATFVLLSLLFLGIGIVASRHLKMASIQAFALRSGWLGWAVVAAVGLFSPLLFLPRWPVAVVAAMLYGVGWGSLLANASSTAGAWLQYRLVNSTLSRQTDRLLGRSRWSHLLHDPDNQFAGLLILRAFPLSNFVATNIVAGMVRVPQRTYVIASFLGMIPSTVMYAAWGKTVREPSRPFQMLIGLMLVFLIAGTWWFQRRMRTRESGRKQRTDG